VGTTTTWYTQALSDAQECTSSVISNTTNLTVGYPSSTDKRVAYRVQPSISQDGERVIVSTATSSIKCSTGNGDGAFISPIGVHDGSAPDLTSDNLAFNYTEIEPNIDFSVPSTRSAGDVYTTGSLKDHVQAWFNRSGYSSSDYLGVIWEGGDSAKNEYIDTYQGNTSATGDRCRVACTYHKASKAKWNGTANSKLKLNGVGSDNLIELV